MVEVGVGNAVRSFAECIIIQMALKDLAETLMTRVVKMKSDTRKKTIVLEVIIVIVSHGNSYASKIDQYAVKHQFTQ